MVGTITVEPGAILERDVIPQLCQTFTLTPDEVGAVLESATESSALVGSAARGFRRMEGMIPPGTYPVASGATLDELAAVWVRDSQRRYERITANSSQANDLSADQRVVLASMVEAECLGGEHGAQVASVFLNRLADGSRLQSCVTAEYALGYQRPYLLNSDVATRSNYNTYQVDGLPEGAICAVSDGSLAAATASSRDADAYYFFYDYIEGDMHFFADYPEFRTAARASRRRFDRESEVGAHDKVNKQELYSRSGPAVEEAD